MFNQRQWLLVVLLVLLGLNSTGLGAANRRWDAARSAAIDARMREFISAGEIAGAVTLVATRDRILHHRAVGNADLTRDLAMSPDAIFWIASMTKPVTAVAVMMLQESGKLSVHDQVSRYLPEFAALQTPSGKPARLTIAHLLTHTSGLAEAPREQLSTARNLAQLIPVYLSKPVAFEPGSQWRYSQSSINTAARIVEVVSGQDFATFLQQRLFTPLGMKDTTFYLSPSQMDRLARSYRKVDGKLQETPIVILHDRAATDRDRYPAANGGLFSTASDYARFCQLLLRGGEFNGRRYLKPETIKQLVTIQTNDLKTGFTEGNGWGLGVCVVRQPQGVTAMLSPGSFGHGGAYGTQAWIDPVKGMVYILMVQRADFPNSDASDVRQQFQQAAAGQ